MDFRKGMIASLFIAGATVTSAQQMLHIPVNREIQAVPVSTGVATEKSSDAKSPYPVKNVRGNFVALGPTEDCIAQKAILQAVVRYHITKCAAWAFRLTTRNAVLTLVDFSLSTNDETEMNYGPIRGPIPFGLFDPIEDDLAILNNGEALRGRVRYLSVPTGGDTLNIIQSFNKK